MSDNPKLLLLGDSIRMSYQPHVAKMLDGKAEVVGPADNCQYSLFTLSSLNRWLSALGRPDVVHWNNGIHDAGHNPDRAPIQIPLDIYRKNIEFILKRLTATTPKVVWATTTPVHTDRPFRDTEWSWRNDEIDSYNDAAREVMQEADIPINDLHALVASDHDAYLSDDQLHLSEAGQIACAEAVVRSVSGVL